MDLLTRFLILFLRFGSIMLIVLAGWLLYREYVAFSSIYDKYPPELTAAGIPIGGLTRSQAEQRLYEAYIVPVKLYYQEEAILLTPQQSGFQLNIDGILNEADQERKPNPSENAFLSHLKGDTYISSNHIPIDYSVSQEQIANYLLNDVSSRYDISPEEAKPYPGLPVYQAGSPGRALDIPSAIPLIENALISLTDRVVYLPVRDLPALPPVFENLEVHLKQIIELAGYDGLLGVYLHDLETGSEIHFGLNQGFEISTDPDIPFTASSVIKIPVMISAFNRIEGEETQEISYRLERMIGHSDNSATDWMVSSLIDPVYGPLLVTEDMRTLELNNTFLAGYFALGSPLLQRYETPANRRQDISIKLDSYNQTTPSDMGKLLSWIYYCAKDGSGPLLEFFSDTLNQPVCSRMIDYLKLDKIPFLLQAGVPEGTPVAHKHGWVAMASTGIIHDISDAAIIFTPGGDYVLSVFLYHPQQLLFEPNNLLVSELSRAVYNFYNPPQ
jgi:beta-lactamase class A